MRRQQPGHETRIDDGGVTGASRRLKRIPRESTDSDSTDVDWESCDRITYTWQPRDVKRTDTVRGDGPCGS